MVKNHWILPEYQWLEQGKASRIKRQEEVWIMSGKIVRDVLLHGTIENPEHRGKHLECTKCEENAVQYDPLRRRYTCFMRICGASELTGENQYSLGVASC